MIPQTREGAATTTAPPPNGRSTMGWPRPPHSTCIHPSRSRYSGEHFLKAYLRVANTPWLACTIAATLPVILRLALLPWFPVRSRLSTTNSVTSWAQIRSHPAASQSAASAVAAFRIDAHHPAADLRLEVSAATVPRSRVGNETGTSLDTESLLSVAVMGACFYWCLQGWLSLTPALLGAILVAPFRNILLLDEFILGWHRCRNRRSAFDRALPRLIQQPTRQTAFLFALGLVFLGNTRPYEGAIGNPHDRRSDRDLIEKQQRRPAGANRRDSHTGHVNPSRSNDGLLQLSGD